MTPSQQPDEPLAVRKGPHYPADPLVAMSMFKQGKDPAHVSLRRLIRRLTKANIAFAVMGGLAVYAHGYRRFTDDVDVLLTRQSFEEFKRRFVPKNYDPIPGRSRQFIDKQNEVKIDILITGLYPGSGKPGPIAFPDPESVRQEIESVPYITLTALIQLKLAAFRPRDYADVVDLIRANNLDETFRERLHPTLHHDFLKALAHRRREDEYEARNG